MKSKISTTLLAALCLLFQLCLLCACGGGDGITDTETTVAKQTDTTITTTETSVNNAVIEEVTDTVETTVSEETEVKFNFTRRAEKAITLSKGNAPSSWQGMSIYDGRLYQLYNTGYCNVYDLDSGNKQPIAFFPLGSFGTTNHSNSANFGILHYGENPLPLLYVVDGNSADIMKCSVESITEKNGRFTSEKVQEINLDQSGFEALGYTEYWGWPAWLVSNDSEYMYLHGAIYRTNGSMNAYYEKNRYIITKFKLPPIDKKDVLLTANDIISQFTTEYNVDVTQGGTVCGKYLIYTFGFGKTEYPSAIRVWDLESETLTASVDLSYIAEEFEDCSVYNGKLYIITQKGNLYVMDITD